MVEWLISDGAALPLVIILKGLAVGFFAAAPTGPSGVLVIGRTLDKGHLYGFVTGLGISLSDTVYIVCSSLGLSFLLDLIEDKSMSVWFSLAGCILLLVFGIVTFQNNPLNKLRTPQVKRPSLAYAWSSGFAVAIVNPMVIAIYLGLFAYLGLSLSDLNGSEKIVGYLSVVCGDVLWWLFLSTLINKVRNKFDLKGIWVINRILGSVLVIAALVWLVYVFVNR